MKPLALGIACFPTVGGSGVAASQLAVRLAARGHAVHVFSSGRPVRLSEGGGCVLHRVEPGLRAPLENGAYALALAGTMAEVARREHLDLFHVHYALPHAPSALLAQGMARSARERVPRLITALHGTDVTGFGTDPGLRSITRHAVLESDAVTTPSDWLRHAAVERLALPGTTRIEVVPNFVDPTEFHPAGRSRSDVRGLFPDLPWDSSAPPRVLLHASNFRPVKRVGDAVLAFAEVLRSRSAVLVLVGDGPERGSVERMVGALGLADRVAFLGEQLKLAHLVAQADLFVLPSEQESFGLAALEALASGVPVVASDVGGLSELVREGETGRLVPVHNPGALAAAVLDLLSDERRREAMGRSARAFAMTRFRPEPVVTQVEALYREVLARSE